MEKVLLFYHYFYPDEVVSAVIFSNLSQSLKNYGWNVTVIPCNRSWPNGNKPYINQEQWRGVDIYRIWRPKFNQASPLGRLLNSLWMVLVWSFLAFRKKKIRDIDVLILGTDPLFSIFVARVWKLVRPKTKIVQWAIDLHEIAVIESRFKKKSLVLKLSAKAIRWAYRACDLIVDIGSCMKAKFNEYDISSKKVTLTPWALSEPGRPLEVNMQERKNVFGTANLILAYSGSFSRSHTCDMFIELARRLKGVDLVMAFSVNGNRTDVLREAIDSSDSNIRVVPFAPMSKLEQRLGASDIHLASLRSVSTGCVVPSKFFGSLAVGRPILFAGDSNSAIAKWIDEYNVGWVLSEATIDQIIKDLIRLSENREELYEMQQRCCKVYQDNFSKQHVTEQWDQQLRKLIGKELF